MDKNRQRYQHSELIEKNRKVLNDRLQDSIRQTGNQLYGLFYDMLKSGKITKIQDFIQKLKQENAKPTRIKRWQFHYQHLSHLQQSVLKLLRQYFDEKFIEIASDPQIGGLYFNQDLKDIIRFDFIFGYRPHNPVTSDDVENYTARFFLQGGYKQLGKSEEKKEKKKEKKHSIWLAQGHRLLNTEHYPQYKELLLSGAQSSIQQYCQRFDIDIQNPIRYKKFLESYFIYILKDSLLQNKLILDMKKAKDLEVLKMFIQDLIDYLQQQIGDKLNIEIGLIIKKIFKNINSDEILPLEFTYLNTSIEDIFQREEYFDQTYFSSRNTSAKTIYAQVMTEFGEQSDLIKATHALYSPDYFILKDKTEKLKSDLYILNNCEPKDINLQNTIDSTNEELLLTMTKLDKHFYSKVDKEKKKGKGDSIEKIMQKYMKYYEVPLQYRRNFFVVINYLNHYYGIKSNIYKEAEEHNKKLEDFVLSHPNPKSMILYFVKEYITFKHIQEAIQAKRDKNYEIKLNRLKTNIGAFYTQRNLEIDKSKKIPQNETQLTFNFQA